MSAMTTTPPTVPGWYWVQQKYMSPMPCLVSRLAGYLVVNTVGFFGSRHIDNDRFAGALWSAEPIEPPGERE